MADFTGYRGMTPAAAAAPPQRLPDSALETFKLQIDEILRGYGVVIANPWVQIDGEIIQSLDFHYKGRPLHLYASIRRMQLGFGISYLSDYGVREVFDAPPASAAAEAAAAIQRTFNRVYNFAAPRQPGAA
jgi:hypothetical protein